MKQVVRQAIFTCLRDTRFKPRTRLTKARRFLLLRVLDGYADYLSETDFPLKSSLRYSPRISWAPRFLVETVFVTALHSEFPPPRLRQISRALIVPNPETVSSNSAGLLANPTSPKVHPMPQPMSTTPRPAPVSHLLSRLDKGMHP